MTEAGSSTNQEKTEPVPPTPAHGGGPGDPQEVPVPSEIPAPGTSEEAAPVDSVSAMAPEGLADGETDVRMPRTSTF